jgi:uncharacterized protein (TIGR03437 family)
MVKGLHESQVDRRQSTDQRSAKGAKAASLKQNVRALFLPWEADLKFATSQRNWLVAGILAVAAAGSLAAQTEPAVIVPASTLRFSHVAAATTAPPAQVLRIYTTPSGLQYSATSNAAWLLVSTTPQGPGALTTAGLTGSATQDLYVSVNPQLLTPGEYAGTITLAVQGRTTAIPALNVGLTVATTGSAILRLDNPGIHIRLERGASRTITLTPASTGAAITYGVTGEISPQTNWLSFSTPTGGLVGQTAQEATITINSALLPNIDTAYGTIRLTPLGSTTGSVTLPISVRLDPAPTLQVDPKTVSFRHQLNTVLNPTARAVELTSSSTTTPVPWTAQIVSYTPNVAWVGVSTTRTGLGGAGPLSGTTPATLWAIPDTRLTTTVGTYEAVVRIDSGGTSQNVTVRMVVSTDPQLTATPDTVRFTYSVGGQVPASVPVTVGTTGQTIRFTAAADFGGNAQWFSVAPTTEGQTPSTITITPIEAVLRQLPTDTVYSANVRLTSTNFANTVLDIPVSVNVTGSLTIDVQPRNVDFEGPANIAPASRTVLAKSTTTADQPFTLSVDWLTSPQGWFIYTPQQLTATALGTQIIITPIAQQNPGTYESDLILTPTATPNQPSKIRVRYVVTGTTAITTNPDRTVEVSQSGVTPPADRTIQITAPVGQRFVAINRDNATWLQVTPDQGTIGQDNVTLKFNSAALQPGTHRATVRIQVGGLPVKDIEVILTVAPQSVVVPSASTLTFDFTQGGAAPQAQTLNLTASGPAVAFTATSTVDTGNWLDVNPKSGTTNAVGGAATPLSVTVNPTGLNPGNYTGRITLRDSAVTSASPVVVTVLLRVSAPTPPQNISVVNAATNAPGPVSPGLIIAIKGRNMAPATATSGTVANGLVQTSIGDVRVTFDDVEAPLVYAGPSGDRQGDQINAIVPYAVASRATTRMVVIYKGVRSEAVELRVSDASPGIFTANQAGSGPAALLNQNSTPNLSNNPARPGEVLQVYITGEGMVTPAQQNGRQATQAFQWEPMQRVSARINGQPAEVLYKGSAPGIVAGGLQVNVLIPASLSVTAVTQVPIQIEIGNFSSPAGVTFFAAPRQ